MLVKSTHSHLINVCNSSQIKEGEWHHIVIVLNRQVLKNSTFSLFVNGQHITTQR